MSTSLSARDLALICAVSGVTTLNVFFSGALTVALPTIGKDLHFSQANLQWPISVNALSYGCLLLVFGRLADILGGRTMFVTGSAWFAAWSIAIAFAPNDIAFIIISALLGLGSACNTPAALGIFSSYFPPGPKRNAAFGALGAGQPIGFILGLVLGGTLTETRATWRTIFYLQAGLGFFFVIMGWFVLPKDNDHSKARYTKGLDWGGALLSIAGLGLLTYTLADSTSTKKGWATPRIPIMLAASLVIIGIFIFYERWRDFKGLSVLVPMSIWTHPGARMGSVISLVFFGWWAFNTMAYFATLYYQQVNLHDPLQTSLRFIPMAISGIIVNIGAGYLMAHIRGQTLIIIGLCATAAAPLIFALIDVNGSYWTMMFFVMILTVGADTVYPVGNLLFASTFDSDSQSLAGGIFNVATRLGTSIGLAVTSSIATATSEKYAAAHPTLAADSPEVLMIGFRAAGWTCFAAGIVSLLIACVGLWGTGIVGSAATAVKDTKSLESASASVSSDEKWEQEKETASAV